MRRLAAVCIATAALAAPATAAAPTVTLAASATSVAYGAKVTLSGQISTKKANQQIGLEGTVCPATKATKEGTARTTATGAFSAALAPAASTKYQATYKNGQSAVVTVSVKPLVALKRVARGSYTASVTAGMSLTGKFVLFQRYKKLKRRWVQVKRVALASAVAGTKPTVVSSVSFKSRVASGTRVRAMFSKTQAGPCYLPAASKSLRA